MSPAMGSAIVNMEDEVLECDKQYQKGVRHLCDIGVTKVPSKYILPVPERPNTAEGGDGDPFQIRLPVIDFAELQGSNRAHFLRTLAKACEEHGFFQLVNHGIASEAIKEMIKMGKEFFALPFEERSKYMITDMRSHVRYGTSFNQMKDRVFCWRDFLKLNCQPASDVIPSWPSSPPGLREAAATYSHETKILYLNLVDAILESLGLKEAMGIRSEDDEDEGEGEGSDHVMKEFEEGSQMVVVNCYPSCPEPDLTLGMPPHSDYGFLTLLLQDEVKGLQIHHGGRWVTVEPIPNSFVVNVGDHLEIFSNGRYKSVLHRVLVNPHKSRVSVASLHSLSFDKTIRPSPKLVNEINPRRYKDTDFATFLEYLISNEHKSKSFLDSRKLTCTGN